ncbi:MAG: heavy-metal-associated domain-containing protein [Chitinophagaceae bacterium]|nr:heavy-metal-associated domain-containing protein [Chitinophagaceae bacterium]
MKKLLFVVIAIAGLSMTSHAQTKAMLSATIKTPNALCEVCKTRIEAYLKRYDGILEVNVNFRKGETKVKYLTDRTDIEQIKTAIANCGYDADDVPATEDIYNRLPKTCKKFEDGGGHPKPKVPPPPAPPTPPSNNR